MTYKVQIAAQNYETRNWTISIGMDEFKSVLGTPYCCHMWKILKPQTDDDERWEWCNKADNQHAGQPLKLKNVYFDFNKWDILFRIGKRWISQHNNEINTNYVVESSAHTDYRGSVEYNLALSKTLENRCTITWDKRVLIALRMVIKYYGKQEDQIMQERKFCLHKIAKIDVWVSYL